MDLRYYTYERDGYYYEEYWGSRGLHNPNGWALRKWREGVLIKEAWYLDGELHRCGGPAERSTRWVEQTKQTHGMAKFWYFHGKLHNPDGPAHTWDGTIRCKYYYIHGRRVDKNEQRTLQVRKVIAEILPQPIAEEVTEYYRFYYF